MRLRASSLFKTKRSKILFSLAALLLLATGVCAYFAWWRAAYFVKVARTVVVDMRQKDNGSFQEKATDHNQTALEAKHFVAFCSRFSENPIGFPGHDFVLWSNQWPPAPLLTQCDTSGFYPYRATDQVAALFTPVSGAFVKEPRCPNPECVEYALVAAVDEEAYERSQKVRDQWQKAKFKVFDSDCVSFVDAVAATIGLQRPARATLFPQDYVSRLRELNTVPKLN